MVSLEYMYKINSFTQKLVGLIYYIRDQHKMPRVLSLLSRGKLNRKE